MTRKNLEIYRPFRRARRAVVIAETKGFAHGIASGCHEIAPADFDEVEAVTLSCDVDPRANCPGSRSERPPPGRLRHLDLLAQPERPLDRHEATQNRLQSLALVPTVLV